ncbi:MAG: helix-turn-helix transcriptional regulator [Bacteroidales bacterium]|nr:helix-turn-helix transcriptional regulator [Bacteroidales bacterium]
MTDRIELILKTQNLTPTQFADAIGIQRSSMSHILARRNKPSLDFVTKLLKRFPEINAEWLLTGKNQMFDIGAQAPTLPAEQAPQVNSLKTPEFEWEDEDFETAARNDVATSLSTPPVEHKKIQHTSKPDLNQNSDIERIIVFFTDGTFKSYS